ncbi:D-hexose-6-phosphate mutarotase [Paludibacterium yongneupense]|uniref:D-hexose-6-phosphate mutarotase n=1 Tax=Paludibacterium yongneupense TaxID=400061 RepID=UPI0003F9BA03|nr:D-hexose-6-phosphate mutarotase [Paludibacterium yongneupense]
MKSNKFPDMLQLPGVRHVELAPACFAVEVTTDRFQATIALQGGQLITFTPTDGEALLYLSPTAIFEPGVPVRGGIPVCWPWFGPHPDDTTAPAHGVARNRDWALTSIDRHDEQFHVKLAGPRHDGLSVEISYLLSERGVTCSLSTHNESPRPQTLSAALHSYLAISSAAAVEISGMGNCRYDDKVLHARAIAEPAPLRIDREIDRVYYTATPVTVADAGWQRQITVSNSGSGSCVVWNPWLARSRSIADLPDDAWNHFVCVEAANALDDSQTLAPGETHTLKTQIEIAAR